MIGLFLRKIFGTQNERTLKKLQPIVDDINAREAAVQKLSDDALRAKTDEFRGRLKNGETLDNILPEAFAVVREAGKRVLNMRHFDVQLLGGIVLHQGNIAEMVTGEGKTLVATLPVYLNALQGKGVHVITVNDYLARRDRDWMGPLYEFLGLTIGVIQHDIDPRERKAAYNCDITYGTNNEYGFDYLRDNMVVEKAQRVQRKLHFAIIDEVDSILVDEARTPLIISGPTEDSTDKYYHIERFVRRISGRKITDHEIIEAKNKGIDYEKGFDYLVDEKHRNIWFTEQGEKKFEEHFKFTLDDPRYIDFKHHRDQAVKAKELFRLDVDYVIKDNGVVIVDEFTGRLMPGRRFSDGLHQALEAKEGVKIERENQTLATVTFQNFFRMYEKLGGMTGTAETEAVEFDKIYSLDVVVMPTNRPLIRKNHTDVIYKTEREKFNAVIDEIVQEHKEGRPVLVGTVSIDKSERLSNILRKRGIAHSVLNAKNHEREAEIISQAGQPGTITISTNMAGRGTDIVLGEGVASRGGLHVIGTERHEARRIDNQLRGRSGRQGDPGSSRFFLSLEDDLMRIFGGDKIFHIMDRLGMEEGQDIQHPLVTKAIETAQKRVEARNFDIRKHLLEYDNVMNRQREIIYEERRKILESEELITYIADMAEDVIESSMMQYADPDVDEGDRDENALFSYLKNKFMVSFDDFAEQKMTVIELIDCIVERLVAVLKERQSKSDIPIHVMQRPILMHIIDSKWKEHLHNLDSLREGITLRAYGQRDPLVEYKHEAFTMFDEMVEAIKDEAIEFVFKMEVARKAPVASVFQSSSQQYLHPEHKQPQAPAPSPQASPGPPLPRQPIPDRATVRRDNPKIGRNDPCSCGSGKKYKKCCGQ